MHQTLLNENQLRPVRRAPAGFTLLELLVVISIVGILGALLSTALNHTKGRVHQISCLANLRQLHVSWFIYSDENDDLLALNRSEATSNEQVFGRRNKTNSWVAGNPKEDATTEGIEIGKLFPYTKSVSLYRCPSDQSTVIGKDIRRTRSYSMSAYMSGDRAGIDPRVKTTYSALQASSPEKLFVFMEEHEASLWGGSFFVIPKDNSILGSSTWTSTPSNRHREGSNLAFADGHVEYWKWLSKNTANLASKPVLNSLELRDLRRLQDCIPKL
jgi:prepilin-type N-terminal cleavage/methylation domain-containing protein/prepilin-type processing-associated H-X9-DG protein